MELFGAVARLVPKDEVAKNPKAKAALDKEWENLRTKGVWDESKFASAKALWTKLAKVGRPFIFTTSSKHVMKRVVTFPQTIPVESSRDVLCFKGTTFVTKIQIMLCLPS